MFASSEIRVFFIRVFRTDISIQMGCVLKKKEVSAWLVDVIKGM